METKTLRILIADKNRDSRSALALLLETRLGATIVEEVSTMDALVEQAADTHPDVVLLYWELPGKPEADRIVIVRSVAPGVQVVVISARPGSAALAVGAEAFINKTDPPESILTVLERKE
jgi:DNA-binding NarL/FixJ family response regulator